jgi:hypothetical protein
MGGINDGVKLDPPYLGNRSVQGRAYRIAIRRKHLGIPVVSTRAAPASAMKRFFCHRIAVPEKIQMLAGGDAALPIERI